MALARTGGSDESEAARKPVGARAAAVLVAHALLLTFVLRPLIATEIPPLVDYPNHLARMHILSSIGGDPVLAGAYRVEWRLVPNLAIDLIVPGLARLMPLVDAGRLFIALTMALLVAGVTALSFAAHRRLGFATIGAYLIVFNINLGWGLLNFCFAIGLSLLAFAGWLLTEHWRWRRRLALFAVAASAIYSAHLFGFLCYGLCVALHELRRAFGEPRPLRAMLRRGLAAGAQFLPAAVALAYSWLAAPESAAYVGPGSWFGNAEAKLAALLSPLLLYGGWPDALLVLFAAAILALALIGRGFRLASALRPQLLVFLMLALLAPHVAGGIWADSRVALMLAGLAAAAVAPGEPGRLAGSIAALIAVGLVGAKTWQVERAWREPARNYAEFRAAAAALAPGARLLPVFDTGAVDRPSASGMAGWSIGGLAIRGLAGSKLAWRNLACLAVIERGVFLPTMFMLPTTQPLRAGAAHAYLDPVWPTRKLTLLDLADGADPAAAAALRAEARRIRFNPFWADWPSHFDYVLVIHEAAGQRGNPDPTRLERVASGSFFAIYRVHRRG
jgi:hypothetical protein